MSYKYIDNVAAPQYIKDFLGFLDLLLGSSGGPNTVFDVGDKLFDSPQMRKCVQWIKKDPASAAMLEEKYMGPDYDIKAMAAMPKNSLGWTYAKVIGTMGYDPDFYRVRPTLDTDADYILSRVRKTHDMHHIISGFSLDDYGEFGAISLIVSQTGYPSFLLISLMGLALQFFIEEEREGLDLESRFDTFSAGINMGRKAKAIFPVKWEEGLERPLDEWREELNIIPVTEGEWSWYSRPELRAAIGLD